MWTTIQSLRRCVQEVRQQPGSFDGEETFGMELDALHGSMGRSVAESEAHDLISLGPRADFKFIGQRIAIDDERVIPRRDKGIGQILEDAAAIVMNLRCL